MLQPLVEMMIAHEGGPKVHGLGKEAGVEGDERTSVLINNGKKQLTERESTSHQDAHSTAGNSGQTLYQELRKRSFVALNASGRE